MVVVAIQEVQPKLSRWGLLMTKGDTDPFGSSTPKFVTHYVNVQSYTSWAGRGLVGTAVRRCHNQVSWSIPVLVGPHSALVPGWGVEVGIKGRLLLSTPPGAIPRQTRLESLIKVSREERQCIETYWRGCCNVSGEF